MSDPTALAKACRNGQFNGQIVTGSGVQTMAPKMSGGMPDLDAAQKGSAAGVMKGGKPQKLTTNK